MSIRHYVSIVGTAELHYSATSDTHARRVAARWVRLFWPTFVRNSPIGSIAYAINTDPNILCNVGRYYWHPLCDKGVRGCGISWISQFGPEAAKEQGR